MKASEEIRSILDRCKSGELEHKQSSYFCGTARCVAGWKVHFDFLKDSPEAKPENWVLSDFAHDHTGTSWTDPEWAYAMEQWGLTTEQSERLFQSVASFDDQYAVVAELEEQGK